MINQTPYAAIRAIWERSLPQTRERLDLLDRTAAELSQTRSLTADGRAAALDVAHKLTGSLGMFGYGPATELSRSIEEQLDHPGLPQPERLLRDVVALRAALGL